MPFNLLLTRKFCSKISLNFLLLTFSFHLHFTLVSLWLDRFEAQFWLRQIFMFHICCPIANMHVAEAAAANFMATLNLSQWALRLLLQSQSQSPSQLLENFCFVRHLHYLCNICPVHASVCVCECVCTRLWLLRILLWTHQSWERARERWREEENKQVANGVWRTVSNRLSHFSALLIMHAHRRTCICVCVCVWVSYLGLMHFSIYDCCCNGNCNCNCNASCQCMRRQAHTHTYICTYTLAVASSSFVVIIDILRLKCSPTDFWRPPHPTPHCIYRSK